MLNIMSNSLINNTVKSVNRMHYSISTTTPLTHTPVVRMF